MTENREGGPSDFDVVIGDEEAVEQAEVAVEEADADREAREADIDADREVRVESARLQEEAAQAEMGDVRAKAFELAHRTDEITIPASELDSDELMGKPAELIMRDSNGVEIDMPRLIGTIERADIKFGETFHIDSESNVITVPPDMQQKSFPGLVREIVRVTNRDNGTIGTYIEKELEARSALEGGLQRLYSDWNETPWNEISDQYEKLERDHSKTSADAEQAIDVLMDGLEADYRSQTGRDFYESVGGKEKFRKGIQEALEEQERNLVHKYEKKRGRGIVLGLFEGKNETADKVNFWQYGKSVHNEFKTVKDFRLRRKLREAGSTDNYGRDKRNLLQKALTLPNDLLATYGTTPWLIPGAIMFGVAEAGRKVVGGAMNIIDSWLYKLENWGGKEMYGAFGLDYKGPKKKPEGELEKERKERLEKEAANIMKRGENK